MKRELTVTKKSFFVVKKPLGLESYQDFLCFFDKIKTCVLSLIFVDKNLLC